MNLKKTIPTLAIALTLSACGSNFEWFPPVADTTAPKVSATIEGKTFANNTTALVRTLSTTVTFNSNDPATIYYTTNGNEPSTSSPSVNIASSFSSAQGPSIGITNTILKFFGVDKSPQLNQSATLTIKIVKSP
ncbi:MAG TPA: chitobiase/beta-hexosaminidase C-terminal domain-containing protein [Geobacteraceae bacterium]|nr:chitobiase/beta-hexosaminidase C-terminal domain-containing protein [Geobacteraceae bacterium]